MSKLSFALLIVLSTSPIVVADGGIAAKENQYHQIQDLIQQRKIPSALDEIQKYRNKYPADRAYQTLCSQMYTGEDRPPACQDSPYVIADKYFDQGKKFIDAGDYKGAQDSFHRIVQSFSGTDRVDEAKLLEAYCRRKMAQQTTDAER